MNPRNPEMVDLSIIIVNWNTRKLTLQCIRSIWSHVHGISYEILLVRQLFNGRISTMLSKRLAHSFHREPG